MPKVKALKNYYMDGSHNAGDVYEAHPDHVQLLLCAKCIELVVEPAPAPPPPPEPAPVRKPRVPQQVDWSTRYKRRDQKAEE